MAVWYYCIFWRLIAFFIPLADSAFIYIVNKGGFQTHFRRLEFLAGGITLTRFLSVTWYCPCPHCRTLLLLADAILSRFRHFYTIIISFRLDLPCSLIYSSLIKIVDDTSNCIFILESLGTNPPYL